MLSVAERPPAADGVNLTEMVHVPVGGTVPHPDGEAEKSPGLAPPVETGLTCRSAVPVLVMVTVWAALAVPTAWPPNASELVLRDSVGWVPVPLRPTCCGESAALSEIISVPVRPPVCVGVNVTLIVHVPPGATVVPVHVPDETAKSPDALAPDICRPAFPVF